MGLILLTVLGFFVGLIVGTRKAFVITASAWGVAALVTSILTFGLLPQALLGQRGSVITIATWFLLSLLLTEAGVRLHRPRRQSL